MSSKGAASYLLPGNFQGDAEKVERVNHMAARIAAGDDTVTAAELGELINELPAKTNAKLVGCTIRQSPICNILFERLFDYVFDVESDKPSTPQAMDTDDEDSGLEDFVVILSGDQVKNSTYKSINCARIHVMKLIVSHLAALGETGVKLLQRYMSSTSQSLRTQFVMSMLGSECLQNSDLTEYTMRFPLSQRRKIVCEAATKHRELRLQWVDEMVTNDKMLFTELGENITVVSSALLKRLMDSNEVKLSKLSHWSFHKDLYVEDFENKIAQNNLTNDPVKLGESFKVWLDLLNISDESKASAALRLILKYKPYEIASSQQYKLEQELRELSAKGQLNPSELSSKVLKVMVHSTTLVNLGVEERFQLLEKAIVRAETGWTLDPVLGPHALQLLNLYTVGRRERWSQALGNLMEGVFDSLSSLDYWRTLMAEEKKKKIEDRYDIDHPIILFVRCKAMLETLAKSTFKRVNIIVKVFRAWVRLNKRAAPSLETLGLLNQSMEGDGNSTTPAVAAAVDMKSMWLTWKKTLTSITPPLCSKAEAKWRCARRTNYALGGTTDRRENFYKHFFEIVFQELCVEPAEGLESGLTKAFVELNLGTPDSLIPDFLHDATRSVGATFLNVAINGNEARYELDNYNRLDSEVFASCFPYKVGGRFVEQLTKSALGTETMDPNTCFNKVLDFIRTYYNKKFPISCVSQWCDFLHKIYNSLSEVKSRSVWTQGNKKRLLLVDLDKVETIKNNCLEGMVRAIHSIPISNKELIQKIWDTYESLAWTKKLEEIPTKRVTHESWEMLFDQVIQLVSGNKTGVVLNGFLWPSVWQVFKQLLEMSLSSGEAAYHRVPKAWKIVARSGPATADYLRFKVANFYAKALPDAIARFKGNCSLRLQDELSKIADNGPLNLQLTWDALDEKSRNKEPTIRTETHQTRLNLAFKGPFSVSQVQGVTNVLRVTARRIQNENGMQRQEVYGTIRCLMQKMVLLTLVPHAKLDPEIALEHATAHTEILLDMLYSDTARSDSTSRYAFDKIVGEVAQTVLSNWGTETKPVGKIWLQFASTVHVHQTVNQLGQARNTEIVWSFLSNCKLQSRSRAQVELPSKESIGDVLAECGLEIHPSTLSQMYCLVARQAYDSLEGIQSTAARAYPDMFINPVVYDKEPVSLDEQIEILIECMETAAGFPIFQLEQEKFLSWDGFTLQRFCMFRMLLPGMLWLEVKILRDFFCRVVNSLADPNCPVSHWLQMEKLVQQVSAGSPVRAFKHYYNLVIEFGVPLISKLRNDASSETISIMIMVKNAIQRRFEIAEEETWKKKLGYTEMLGLTEGDAPGAGKTSLPLVRFVLTRMLPKLRQHNVKVKHRGAVSFDVSEQLEVCKSLINLDISAIHHPKVQSLLFAYRQDQLDTFLLAGPESTFEGVFEILCRVERSSTLNKLEKFDVQPFRPKVSADTSSLNAIQAKALARMYFADSQSENVSVNARQVAIDNYVRSPTTTLQEYMELLAQLEANLSCEDQRVAGEATRMLERTILGIFASDQRVHLLAYILSPESISRSKNHQTTVKLLQRVGKYFSAKKVVGLCAALLSEKRRWAIKVSLHKALIRVLLSLIEVPESTQLLLREWKLTTPAHDDVRGVILQGCAGFALVQTTSDADDEAYKAAWEVLNDAARNGDLNPTLRAMVVGLHLECDWVRKACVSLGWAVSGTPSWLHGTDYMNYGGEIRHAPTNASKERFVELQEAVHWNTIRPFKVPILNSGPSSARALLDGTVWSKVVNLITMCAQVDSAKAKELEGTVNFEGLNKEEYKAMREVADNAERHRTLSVFAACNLLELTLTVIPAWLQAAENQHVSISKDEIMLLSENQLQVLEELLLISDNDAPVVYSVTASNNLTTPPYIEYALSRGCALYSAYCCAVLNYTVQHCMGTKPSHVEAYDKACTKLAEEHPLSLRLRKVFGRQLAGLLDTPIRECAKRMAASVKGQYIREGVCGEFFSKSVRTKWTSVIFDDHFEEEIRFLKLGKMIGSIV